MPNLQVHVKKQKYEGAIVDPASGLGPGTGEQDLERQRHPGFCLLVRAVIADNICYELRGKKDHARVRADKRIEVVDWTRRPRPGVLFVQAPTCPAAAPA